MVKLSEKRALSFSYLPWFNDEIFASWIVGHLIYHGNSICDFGSANGYMLDYYKNAFEEIIGIEPNKIFYEHCLTKYQSEKKIRIINAFAENTGLNDNCVDISISKSSLHHFTNMEKSVSEMFRVSKKKCVALIEVIAPDERCVPFLTNVLLLKERGRNLNTVYTEKTLKSYLLEYSNNLISLFFDQFILIETWLENSDLNETNQKSIISLIESQPNEIKKLMQIHKRNNKIAMLRRMNLQIINNA
jgi:ubiquinone/menaquinone biosynthesis C-methylase UbiE